MIDQANQLRQLVRQCARMECATAAERPAIVQVTGGKGGVGTTTVAVNLAAALAARGKRTVLVDADPRGGNVALLCGVDESRSLADVLAGRRTAAAALTTGPGGIRLLSGGWNSGRTADDPPAATQRLLGQLHNLGDEADVVVVDVGNGPSSVKRCFWQAADLRLLVTTPDTAAVLDSYASIKGLALRDNSPAVFTLVNLVSTKKAARSVHARLAQACRRFLGFEPLAAGYVPADAQLAAAARAAAPLVLAARQSDASRQFHRLAETICHFEEKAEPSAAQSTIPVFS
jgi:flagellar biosynthesis protein FlhG